MHGGSESRLFRWPSRKQLRQVLVSKNHIRLHFLIFSCTFLCDAVDSSTYKYGVGKSRCEICKDEKVAHTHLPD